MSQSYGRIDFDPSKRAWIVECPAHVSMRLKRHFPKLRPGSQGRHEISGTRENARDLRWFVQRYPMEVPDMARLERDAIAHKQMEAQVQSIVAGDYVPPAIELALPPREYQKLPAIMMLTRGGVLCADQVGLGKTIEAICALADTRALPAIVVTLLHLPLQWKAEINRFAPALKVHIIKRGTPYNVRFQSGAMPDVVLISYSKLVKWAEHLAGENSTFHAASVFFDEAQELRRSESDKYEAARYIAQNVKYRMLLTGTPIYNYGGEFYSVLNCAFPDELGTRQEFGSEWCAGSTGDKAMIEDPRAFGAYLRDQGLMIRRTRSDVGRELPAAQIIPHTVECDDATLERVSGPCAELARLILRDTKEDVKGQKMHAAEELSNMLRQATGIAKARYVAEFVRMLLETEQRVVVFGWHRAFYAILMEQLKDLKPVLYTGSESPAQKQAAKEAFIKGDSRVFICSLRAGAGLDGLQYVCSTGVAGELDWSPGVHEQNIGRILRDGQANNVFFYYLIAEDGSDPIVSQVLGIKRQQIDGVIKDAVDGDMIENLQRDDSHIKKLAQAYLEKASRKQADDATDLAVQ